MKRHVALAAAVTLFGAAGIAQADTADGVIAEIDWENHTIALDSGEQFVVDEHELTDLSVGDQVTVGFDERDGQMVAHSITAPGDSERSSPGDAPGADPTGAAGATAGDAEGAGGTGADTGGAQQ